MPEGARLERSLNPPPAPWRADTADQDALAAAALALVVVASYSIQRLLDATTEPQMGSIIHQSTIPYFWRVAFATLHGVGAGVALRLSVSAPTAERWLSRTPGLALAIALPAAVLMALVP